MGRPPIERRVASVPRATMFKPAGVPAHSLEQLQLQLDELEALRLVDREGLSHEDAAAVMGVSRQTVGRVLEAARAKVAEALLDGKAIVIGGGAYRVAAESVVCRACGFRWASAPGAGQQGALACPRCGSREVTLCPPDSMCPERGRGRGRGRGAGWRRGQAMMDEAVGGPSTGHDAFAVREVDDEKEIVP